MSLYGLQQARKERAVAEQRSVELEKVAAFQQSMLEGIDIQAMGLGMSSGLREQLAQAQGGNLEALEQVLGHASTPDIARSLIDRNILAGAEQAITRDFAGEPALAADLRESVAHVRNALGLYGEAADDFRRVGDFHAQASGPTSRVALEARLEQASALFNALKTDEAAKVVSAALTQAKTLPANDRLRIGLELQQSQVIAAQGERPRALRLQRALQQRTNEALGEADELSIKTLEVLAITEQLSGDVATGRAYIETVVPLRQAASGRDDPSTLVSMGSLAVMRAVTGDFEGAIALQQSLVKLHTRRLGHEHPVTLSARGNLANMLIDSGRAADARIEAEAVLAACIRVLGANHPQTLRSMLNLSSLYARVDEYDRALAIQQQVINARTRLLGPRHPETVSIRINHAGTLRQADRAAEALDELRELLPLARKVLEKNHPQLQAALMIVASASEDLGRMSAAITAYREVLQMRLVQQGEDHGQTVEAAWQLSGALRAAGQAAESSALRSRYVGPLLAADASSLKPDQARLAQSIRELEQADDAS